MYSPISGGSLYNSGYAVITSINTNGATPNKYDLDGTTRNYVTSQKDFTPFKLQSDYYTADPNDSEYRRAIISLIPGKDDSEDDGFYLNLNVYHGAILISIIKDYFISNS